MHYLYEKVKLPDISCFKRIFTLYFLVCILKFISPFQNKYTYYIFVCLLHVFCVIKNSSKWLESWTYEVLDLKRLKFILWIVRLLRKFQCWNSFYCNLKYSFGISVLRLSILRHNFKCKLYIVAIVNLILKCGCFTII